MKQAAPHEYGTVLAPCQCEHEEHFHSEPCGNPAVHAYQCLFPDRDLVQAQYVGGVCPECARTHMKEFLR